MSSDKTEEQQRHQQQPPLVQTPPSSASATARAVVTPQHNSYIYIRNVQDGKRFKFVSKNDIKTLTGDRIHSFLQSGAGITPPYRVTYHQHVLRQHDVLRDLGVEVGSTLQLEVGISPDDPKGIGKRRPKAGTVAGTEKNEAPPTTAITTTTTTATTTTTKISPEQQQQQQDQQVASDSAIPTPSRNILAPTAATTNSNIDNSNSSRPLEEQEQPLALSVSATSASAVGPEIKQPMITTGTTTTTTITTTPRAANSSTVPQDQRTPRGSQPSTPAAPPTWILIRNTDNNKKFKFVSRGKIQDLTGHRVKQFLNVAAQMDYEEQCLTFDQVEIGGDTILRDVGVTVGSTLLVARRKKVTTIPHQTASPSPLSVEHDEDIKGKGSSTASTKHPSPISRAVGLCPPSPSPPIANADSSSSVLSPSIASAKKDKNNNNNSSNNNNNNTSIYIKNIETGRQYRFVSSSNVAELTGGKIKHFLSVAAGFPVEEQTLRFNNMLIDDYDNLADHGVDHSDVLILESKQFNAGRFLYDGKDKKVTVENILVQMLETILDQKEHMFYASRDELAARRIREFLLPVDDVEDPLFKYRRSVGPTAALQSILNGQFSSSSSSDDESENENDDEKENDENSSSDEDDEDDKDKADNGNDSITKHRNKYNNNNNNPQQVTTVVGFAEDQEQSRHHRARDKLLSDATEAANAPNDFDVYGTMSMMMMVIESGDRSSLPVSASAARNQSQRDDNDNEEEDEDEDEFPLPPPSSHAKESKNNNNNNNLLLSPREKREVVKRIQRKRQNQLNQFCRAETIRRLEITTQHYPISLMRLLSEFEDDLRGTIFDEEDLIFQRKIIQDDAIIMSKLHTQQRIQRRINAKALLDQHISRAAENFEVRYQNELLEARDSDFAVLFRKQCNRAHDHLRDETHLLFQQDKINAWKKFDLEVATEEVEKLERLKNVVGFASAASAGRGGGVGKGVKPSNEELDFTLDDEESENNPAQNHNNVALQFAEINEFLMS